jgi:hypothetical protein
MKTKLHFVLACSASLLAFATGSAMAAEADGVTEEPTGFDDIVVTAQPRGQSSGCTTQRR